MATFLDSEFGSQQSNIRIGICFVLCPPHACRILTKLMAT